MRDLRERTFNGLTPEITLCLQNKPGEVADRYIQVRDDAKRLFDITSEDSPLKGYRKWALHLAEEALRREKEIVEEDTNE